jgi:hypothetical protein
MRPKATFRTRLITTFFGFLVITVVVYGLFRTYPFLTGPKVEITTPHEGETIYEKQFTVSGKTTRAKEVIINGRIVPIDQEGSFSQTFLTRDPYTILVVQVSDKYGKRVIKTLQVMGASN